MAPELLGAAAAFGFGLSDVCVKRGLRDTTAMSGLLITLGAGMAIVSPIVMIEGSGSVHLWALVFFGLAGILGPGVGRIANISAVHIIGPSISAPLQGSTYPLVGFLSGVLLLNEGWTPLSLAGAIAITLGVAVISRNVAPRPVRRQGDGRPSDDAKPQGVQERGLLLAIVAGLCYGVSDLARSRGIALGGAGGTGTAIGLATALCFWAAACLFVPSLKEGLKVGPSAGWFALSGCSAGLASLSIFEAFAVGGHVSVVTPIAATSPLVVLVLSRALLRDVEQVRVGVVLSGATVVLGVVAISV